MVKIYFFLYIKIIDNILLRTFPTPPEKKSQLPWTFSIPPTPEIFFAQTPPQKFLNPHLKISQPPEKISTHKKYFNN